MQQQWSGPRVEAYAGPITPVGLGHLGGEFPGFKYMEHSLGGMAWGSQRACPTGPADSSFHGSGIARGDRVKGPLYLEAQARESSYLDLKLVPEPNKDAAI